MVDGCFWHGCPTHALRPATNSTYWTEKVKGNRARDFDTDQVLCAAGWTVVRVWEHESRSEAVRIVEEALRGGTAQPTLLA